jgi:hypothetical protein
MFGFEGSQSVTARPSGKGKTHDRNYFYDAGKVAL